MIVVLRPVIAPFAGRSLLDLQHITCVHVTLPF